MAGPSVSELVTRMDEAGGAVLAPSSGYLQFVQHETLIGLAAEKGAVIRLLHRPGHFVVAAVPCATVWPSSASEGVSRALRVAHITGPSRTLAQDLAFAVDQLVEIAIRALSPAVNDTFTALTCIDWLGESLCKVTRTMAPAGRPPGQPWVRARDCRARQLQGFGRASFREDPAGGAGNARGVHTPARSAGEDHRSNHESGAGRTDARAGGDDSPRERGIRSRARGPR